MDARRATVNVDFSKVTPWSLCGKPDILNVNFRAVMRKGPEDGIAAFGVAAAGSKDAGEPVMERLALVWKRCGNASTPEPVVGGDEGTQEEEEVLVGEQKEGTGGETAGDV